MPPLFETVKLPDLIFDVGLHRGEDTAFYLKKGFRVVAFEANPDLIALAGERFKSYVADGRLHLVEGAIVSSTEAANGNRKVAFYRNSVGSLWGTVRNDWAERNQEAGAPSNQIEVNAVDFAAVIQTYGMPYYMKVDIEGCDMVCVESLLKFRERPDYLSIESDKTCLANVRGEIAQLASLGYKSFKAVEQSGVGEQVEPNPPREGSHAGHRFEEGASGLFGAELPGRWLSRAQILRRYRAICLGYYLLGDNGILNTSRFIGAARLRALARTILRRFTQAAVPGWYDTHARLCPASL